MKIRRYLSIILVLLTLLSTTLSFASIVKASSMSMDLQAIELTHDTVNYHKDLECKISCGSALMSCSACIVCINSSNFSTTNHQYTLIKHPLASSERLYSVDLPHEQKPPKFS